MIDGATTCTRCQLHMYKGSAGNSECLACPQGKGTGTATGATGPDQCSKSQSTFFFFSASEVNVTKGSLTFSFLWRQENGRGPVNLVYVF